MSSMSWKLIGAASGTAAGWVARAGLKAAWRRARGQEPPENPASPSTSWPEALLWAGASGIGLGVARLVAQRGAAGAWHAATGSYPTEVRQSGAAA